LDGLRKLCRGLFRREWGDVKEGVKGVAWDGTLGKNERVEGL